MAKKYFQERAYSKDFPDRTDVVRVDALPIKKDQFIKLVCISINSPKTQGVAIAVTAGTGFVEYRNRRSKGICIWWGTEPKEVLIKCHSVPGLLAVYNAYIDERGMPASSMYKSGMLVEEQGEKRIYHCNDVNDGDIRFDKLVFSVEKI